MLHHSHVGAIIVGGTTAVVGAAAAALVVYVKAHALSIAFAAAMTAVTVYAKTGDVDDAIEAAFKKGMGVAAEDAVRDFLRLEWKFS